MSESVKKLTLICDKDDDRLLSVRDMVWAAGSRVREASLDAVAYKLRPDGSCPVLV